MMRRWAPPGFFLLAVFAVWGLLQFHSSVGNDPIDRVLFTLMFVNYALITMMMVVDTTEGWSDRALGLFGSFCGDVMLWYLVIAPRYGWGWELAPHVQVESSPYLPPEWLTDLFRSFFYVSGPLLAVALARRLWRQRPGQDDGDKRLFVLTDEHGVILFATEASEAMLGWPNGSLIGKPLTTIIPERFHAAHRAGFQHWQATNEGPIFGKVLRVPVRKADGTETVVCLSISSADGVGGRQAVATLIPGDQCPAVDLDLTEGQDA